LDIAETASPRQGVAHQPGAADGDDHRVAILGGTAAKLLWIEA
jgi:hypothetical protein